MPIKHSEITPEEKAMLDKVKAQGADTRLSFHIWQCTACPDQPAFDAAQSFLEHLKTVHKVNVKKAKVQQQQTMHLDGTKYFQTFYDCQIIGTNVTYTKNILEARTGEDAAWWRG